MSPPVNELFVTPSGARSLWPELAHDSPVLLAQLARHALHVDNIVKTLDALKGPLTHALDAPETNRCGPEQLTSMYTSLTEIISDPDYSRLILYLPFELLPALPISTPDIELSAALCAFVNAYVKSWYDLLSVHDARANFTNGDVLEIDLRTDDVPRVVKAAHLAPLLMDIGYVTGKDVATIIEATDDWVLRESLSEALQALEVPEPEHILLSKPELLIHLQQTLDELPTRLSGIPTTNTTERRLAWLQQTLIADTTDELAELLAQGILTQKIDREDLLNVVESPTAYSTKVVIQAMEKVIENTALDDIDSSNDFYEAFKNILLQAWDQADHGTKKQLTMVFRRLCNLGVTPQTLLTQLGIELAQLDVPFSHNIANMPDEIENIRNFISTIESDPELSRFIYPISMLFGSRIKGYGEKDADLDIGIFIKPGTPYEVRHIIREKLETYARYDGKPLEPMEFWLDEKDGELTIHDFDTYDRFVADSYWTHMLFGSVWVGDNVAIREIQGNLLPQYFRESPVELYGRNVRQLYLESIERDVLQYRLMHKGYSRHFPSFINKGARKKLADGASAFWDPGYRRIATKLFVRMVYLPNI